MVSNAENVSIWWRNHVMHIAHELWPIRYLNFTLDSDILNFYRLTSMAQHNGNQNKHRICYLWLMQHDNILVHVTDYKINPLFISRLSFRNEKYKHVFWIHRTALFYCYLAHRKRLWVSDIGRRGLAPVRLIYWQLGNGKNFQKILTTLLETAYKRMNMKMLSAKYPFHGTWQSSFALPWHAWLLDRCVLLHLLNTIARPFDFEIRVRESNRFTLQWRHDEQDGV